MHEAKLCCGPQAPMNGCSSTQTNAKSQSPVPQTNPIGKQAVSDGIVKTEAKVGCICYRYESRGLVPKDIHSERDR